MAVFEEMPVPGWYTGDTYKHDEIMYSEHGWHPKDCTLGTGNGEVLLGGTVIARSDVDKCYYAYDPDGEDGLNVARGLIWTSAKLGPRRQLANIIEGGWVKLEKVHGLDDAAKEQLGAIVDDVRGYMKF
jgi:hypothetical protein